MTSYQKFLRVFSSSQAFGALGLTIMISLLISPGALIQQAFLGLSDIDAYTLYEAIHDQGINLSPSFYEWLAFSLMPEFIILSIITSVFSMTWNSSNRNLVFVVWICIAIGLTAMDVIFAIQYKTLNLPDFLNNSIMNTIGAGLVAFLVLISTLFIAKIATIDKYLLAPFCFPVAVGLIFSGIGYLSITLFTHLLPVETEISLKGEISGYFSSDKPIKGTLNEGDEFALIPKSARLRKLELTGNGVGKIRWKKTSSDSKFSLSMYLIENCWGDFDVDEDTLGRPLFIRQNIQSFSVINDLGIQQLQFLGTQSLLTVDDTPITMFWIKNIQPASTVDFTQFLSEEAELSVATDGGLSVRLTGGMMERSVGKSVLASKIFTLNIDGQEQILEFLPPPKFSDEELPKCTKIKSALDSNDKITVDGILQGGLLLKINRSTVPIGHKDDFDGIVHIDNANGWLSTPQIAIFDLTQTSGLIQFFQFQSLTSMVSVNGEPVDISGGQVITGFGSLTSSFQEDGMLLLSGKLQGASVAGKRLNPTRWELMPSELKITLFSALGAFAIWIARLSIKRRWLVM